MEYSKLKQLMAKGQLIKHHTATAMGYVSRKADAPDIIYPYKGRFGEGYTHHEPNWSSNRYHYITYYVRPTGGK